MKIKPAHYLQGAFAYSKYKGIITFWMYMQLVKEKNKKFNLYSQKFGLSVKNITP